MQTYAAFSGASLVCTVEYEDEPPPVDDEDSMLPLQSGVAVTDLAGNVGETLYFILQVPDSNTDSVECVMSGGDG